VYSTPESRLCYRPHHHAIGLRQQCTIEILLQIGSFFHKVLWHCWLGHLTRKIVSEINYIVSSETLNPTIPYLVQKVLHITRNIHEWWLWNVSIYINGVTLQDREQCRCDASACVVRVCVTSHVIIQRRITDTRARRWWCKPRTNIRGSVSSRSTLCSIVTDALSVGRSLDFLDLRVSSKQWLYTKLLLLITL